MSDIQTRKTDHLDLTVSADVGFRRRNLLEEVELLHDSLPELSLDELDTSVSLLGKRLKYPLIIAAMTGGTGRAMEVNRTLARLAEAHGLGFGLGSQRPMLDDARLTGSFCVREVAPTALVLGNIGGVQAARCSSQELTELVLAVGADALCVHLNPAMELAQPEGDRSFKGIADAIARLVAELPVPLVVKETGCGLSGAVTRRLHRLGVRHVDVSGAGGTSWVAVENERNLPAARGVGETFREWGIPTAASVAFADDAKMETIIATGGIQSGLDIARALALGASAAGIARPLLQALELRGLEAADQLLTRLEQEFRTAMLLTGTARASELRRVPRRVGPELRSWLALL